VKAIVEIAGKQYVVQEGDEVFVDRLEATEGEDVTFDKVMLVFGEGDMKIGAPNIEGASIAATIIKHGKSKKITVFKYKAKKNYKRKRGHRAYYTKVKINKICA